MKRNCSFNPVFRTLATTRCYSLGLFIQYPVAIELTTKPLWGEHCVYCRIHYCTIFLTQRTMNGWPRVIRKQADNQTARQTTRQTNHQDLVGDDATDERWERCTGRAWDGFKLNPKIYNFSPPLPEGRHQAKRGKHSQTHAYSYMYLVLSTTGHHPFQHKNIFRVRDIPHTHTLKRRAQTITRDQFCKLSKSSKHGSK